jgi:hypothetical protein
VFLGAHGAYYGMAAKYERLAKGQENPFIDPAGYKAYISDREQAYLKNLKEQQAPRSSVALRSLTVTAPKWRPLTQGVLVRR